MEAIDARIGRLALRPHPHLMEIPTWSWLEEMEPRAGRPLTVGQVPDEEWDRLKSLGFDLVWLMGVWKRSPAARRLFRNDPSRFRDYDRALPDWRLADITGSPYAVGDYQPDPRIGSWDEIDAVRRKLRARGIGLILDFVCNHTAADHPWVKAHPEYYVEGSEAEFHAHPAEFTVLEESGGKFRFLACGRDPYFPGWRDTAQLNHFEPGARAALIEGVRRIAGHADGLRCDMAMLALNDIFARTWPATRPKQPPKEEFWTAAIAAAPELVWLAEAYWGAETRLQELGFRYTYDKEFYDALRAGQAAAVRQRLASEFGHQQRLARFLENHDEERAALAFAGGLEAPATLAATAPGLRFYFHGQLESRKIHQPVELARAADEPVDPVARSLYGRLLALSNEEVFHTGRWSLLGASPAGDASNRNLVAYQWRSEKNWKLVAANVSGQTSEGRIALGEPPGAGPWVFSDQLHGVDYVRSSADLAGGLFVRLEPWRAHIFDISGGG